MLANSLEKQEELAHTTSARRIWVRETVYYYFRALLDLRFLASFALAALSFWRALLASSFSIEGILSFFFSFASARDWRLTFLKAEASNLSRKYAFWRARGNSMVLTKWKINFNPSKYFENEIDPAYSCSIFFNCSGGVIPGTLCLYILVISSKSFWWFAALLSDWLRDESHCILIESDECA